MKNTAIIILLLFCSCTTIVSRDLPIKKLEVHDKNQKSLSLLVHSPRTILPMKRKLLEKYLESTQLFSKILVLDEYELAPEELYKQYDRHLELNFISAGYFHPYCIIFLTIIPCTPPVQWALGVKATRHGIKETKTYLIKEDATEITWAFGFLFPGFGKQRVKRQEVLENMLNHLLAKLKTDDYFIEDRLK